ncbi:MULTISPECIES: hypothetical protein [Enterobacter]|uniref:hypothetical protein n=1 Tax=Enterobacter TaxID=547 RepID=UPI0028EB0FCC|nr:hypothetical protein [Enterobacter cloacae]WNT35304.1 hypothetical protein RRL13_16145 [Enterobacter cloacae]
MEHAEEEKERQTAALLTWEMIILCKEMLVSSMGNSDHSGGLTSGYSLATKDAITSAELLRRAISPA